MTGTPRWFGAAPTRWWPVGLLALTLVATLATAPGPIPASRVVQQECGSVASTEGDALSMADSCGQPVVIDSSRSEFAQVTAQPDGRLTFESAAVPQRARKGGRWADIDLTLHRGTDGLWRPNVSVADVMFGNGGSGPLVTLSREGLSMAMSWPGGTLAAPSVVGDEATYASVFPDVDLVLRATRTGFTHTLVVKTPAAAANPAVRTLHFNLSGDVQVVPGPDGALRALAGGTVLASAEPAVMWDSRTNAVSITQPELSDGGARSTSAFAGDAARAAGVRTDIVGNDLVLSPDLGLLDAPDATFPIYIDPAWSVLRSRWAYATNNGSSNSDHTVARVGLNPDTGAVYRSFFEFLTTANGVSLKGKHIESARVEMKVDHTWSCGDTPSHLYRTPAIDKTMKATWSKMTLSVWMDVAYSHANEAGGCSQIYPDMLVQFEGSSVTSQVQAAASGNWSSITVGLTARDADGTDESRQDRWKRYFPGSAKLFVDYDSKPGLPTGMQVAGVACLPSGAVSIGTLTPTLSAVLPDADSQTLLGAFEWVEVPASGNPDQATVKHRIQPDPTATANTRATTIPITVQTGKVYAFHVTSRDPSPYLLWSGWSPWCTFQVDTSVPPAPTVTPGLATGPGYPVTVTFSSTLPTVTKFRYGWSSPPGLEVPATGANPKTATVSVTVPAYGVNTLWARAVDSAGTLGNLSSADITAPRPASPIARWALETTPGVGLAEALADRQPAPVDSPLTATNVTWPSDVRLSAGQTATFNGSASSAATAASVVNTTDSFSVAAWVRVPSMPSTDMKVVVQEGTGAGSAAGFALGVRRMGDPLQPYWSFLMKDAPLQTANTRSAHSAAPIAVAEIGRWTHLAGVYDEAAGKLRLYVNGVLASEIDRPVAPWSSTGRLVVGRGFGNGAAEGWWAGSIADVQVFDRVLVNHDFTGQLKSDPRSGGYHEPGILSPSLVGAWDFETAVPCFEATAPDTCEAPDTTTGWDRWLALSLGTGVDAGEAGVGSALALDDQLFPDLDPPILTREYGRSALKSGPPEGPPVWTNRPVLRTDQSFTVSAWVRLDATAATQRVMTQDGAAHGGFTVSYVPTAGGQWEVRVPNSASSAEATALALAAVDAVGTWHHLVASLDAQGRWLRLYVDGTLRGGIAMHSGWQPWQATGPLALGRAIVASAESGWLLGAIDDAHAYQGVLSDAAVAELYESQSG